MSKSRPQMVHPFWMRLPPKEHQRLRNVAKREARYMNDVAREGVIKYLDELDRKVIERETVAEALRKSKINPTWEDLPPTSRQRKKAAAAAAPPTITNPGLAQVDVLAAYIEAATTEEEAAKRLAKALEMIDEAAETAEEADRLIRALEARAKKR